MARSRTRKMTTRRGVGTRCYLPPEMLAGEENYDQKADIFGFGTVLFELIALPKDQSLVPMSAAGTLDHRARLYGLAGKQGDGEPEVVKRSTNSATVTWCKNRLRLLEQKALLDSGEPDADAVAICLESLAYSAARRPTANAILGKEW